MIEIPEFEWKKPAALSLSKTPTRTISFFSTTKNKKKKSTKDCLHLSKLEKTFKGESPKLWLFGSVNFVFKYHIPIHFHFETPSQKFTWISKRKRTHSGVSNKNGGWKWNVRVWIDLTTSHFWQDQRQSIWSNFFTADGFETTIWTTEASFGSWRKFF
jgi:hypothetical protein